MLKNETFTALDGRELKLLLKLIRIVSAFILVGLGGYALITGTHNSIPYMLLFAGIVTFATGVAEFKGGRKGNAVISFLASAFVVTVVLLTI